MSGNVCSDHRYLLVSHIAPGSVGRDRWLVRQMYLARRVSSWVLWEFNPLHVF